MNNYNGQQYQLVFAIAPISDENIRDYFSSGSCLIDAELYYLPNMAGCTLLECAKFIRSTPLRSHMYKDAQIQADPLPSVAGIERFREVVKMTRQDDQGRSQVFVDRITSIMDPTTHCCYIMIIAGWEEPKNRESWAGIEKMEESFSIMPGQ
jgi:hypothetical protein